MKPKIEFPSLTFSLECHRLFHGRGELYTGWEEVNIDFYPPVVHIILYKNMEESKLAHLLNELKTFLKQDDLCFVLQRKYLKELSWEVLEGELPENNFVSSVGLQFPLKFLKNQNIGFFPDMAPGRRWISKYSHGRKILNLFSYTCSLSVIALQKGAQSVLNVDMSRSSLNIGREAHQVNNIPMERVSFRQVDIMKSLGSLSKKGPYDLIIIDPPSLQKGSFDASKDYRKIIRRLDNMLALNGLVMACLNSPFLDSAFLKNLFLEEAPGLIFKELIFREAPYKEKNPEKGLKILIYQKS